MNRKILSLIKKNDQDRLVLYSWSIGQEEEVDWIALDNLDSNPMLVVCLG